MTQRKARKARHTENSMPYSYDARERKLQVFYNLSPKQKSDGWATAHNLPYRITQKRKN